MKRFFLISFPSWLIVVISLLHIGCEETVPELEKNITVPFVNIPGGTFMMGSPIDEANRRSDETQHVVTIDPFRMSIYEITNTEFAAFLNARNVDRYGKYPEGSIVTKALVYYKKGWGVWYTDNQWVPVEGYENHPVVDVIPYR